MVAVNPFKEVPLYGRDYVTAYKQKLKDSPHIFAIADTAFNEMMRGRQVSFVENCAVLLVMPISGYMNFWTN